MYQLDLDVEQQISDNRECWQHYKNMGLLEH